MVEEIDEMTLQEIITRIENLNSGLAEFWRASKGWEPVEAAGLLNKARLDWQVSLSTTLRLWLRDPPATLSDGELILAWSNLGSLVEGTLKLLLSVFYEDYKPDVVALKRANAFDPEKSQARSPDGLGLKSLRIFVRERELIGPAGDALVELVPKRRNAIHAFQDRSLGDDGELRYAIGAYLALLRHVNELLPYPDGIRGPTETSRRRLTRSEPRKDPWQKRGPTQKRPSLRIVD